MSLKTDLPNALNILEPLPSKNELAELLSYLTPQELVELDSLLLESTIDLPTPYPLQQAIKDHPARYKVIACGRQVGKTILCALDARDCLIAGKRALYTSPSQKQTDQFWEYVKRFTEDLRPYRHDSRRIMRLGDGLLDVQTASQPDTLRSGHYDRIYFDECAYLDARVWSQVGIPMLLARDGGAWFMSTPKRRNWFFQHFIRARDAQASGSDRWTVWNFATTENPYLSEAALEALTGEMTEEDYQQEILAQFLEGQGAVFRYVDSICVLPRVEPFEGRFVMGVDWAQVRDFTVLIVMDRETRRVVDMDRFNGVDWALQRGRLMTLAQKWNPEVIYAESNSIGGPNIEALVRDGLPVRPFETTGVSKPPLIESLVLAFDRSEIACLDDPVLKGELMAFERKVSTTGRSQYSAPDGMHDDTVMALAIAWHAVTRPKAEDLIAFI